MGASLTESLNQLRERVDSTNLRSFVRAVVQGERLGVSIGQVMRDLAVDMRKRRRQMAEEQAQKTPVKLLLPLVFLILPTIFIVVLVPPIARPRQQPLRAGTVQQHERGSTAGMPVRGASRSATSDTKRHPPSGARWNSGGRHEAALPSDQEDRCSHGRSRSARGPRTEEQTPRTASPGARDLRDRDLPSAWSSAPGCTRPCSAGQRWRRRRRPPIPPAPRRRRPSLHREAPMKLTSSALARRPGVPMRRRTPAHTHGSRRGDGSSPAYRRWSGGSGSGQPRGSGSRRIRSPDVPAAAAPATDATSSDAASHHGATTETSIQGHERPHPSSRAALRPRSRSGTPMRTPSRRSPSTLRLLPTLRSRPTLQSRRPPAPSPSTRRRRCSPRWAR